jgi:shikimate dehydrogenase
LKSFQRELPDVRLERVILLGAGGAGAAVARALIELGAGWIGVCDVNGAKAETLAHRLEADHGPGRAAALDDLRSTSLEADGLVNTTPMGMAKYPGVPMSADLLHARLWLADIIYFPLETELLRRARAVGCRTMNGVGMAVFQAADAFHIFTGLEPNVDRMYRHFETLSGTPVGRQLSA